MDKKQSIGALYERHGKNGLFYSGFIEINGQKQDIVIFKNNRPKSDKSPHMTIFPSEKRQQGYQGPSHTHTNAPYTVSFGGDDRTPGSPTQKQLGLLYATAQRNGWSRAQVVSAVMENTGGRPEELTKDRFQSALGYFTKTRAPKEEKVVKNYAPTVENDNFGEPPAWLNEGPDPLPF